MERRFLQIVIAVAGLVPVGAGAGGVIYGPTFIGLANTPSAWSHVRYLSGLLFAIGVILWASIPAIEQHQKRFTLLLLIVFSGGVARLTGCLALGDAPGWGMCLALAMELLVTPGLWAWQRRISERAA